MSIGLAHHCTAAINATHVVSVGGEQGNDAANDIKNVIVTNWQTGASTFLPALDRVRSDPVCGIVTRYYK